MHLLRTYYDVPTTMYLLRCMPRLSPYMNIELNFTKVIAGTVLREGVTAILVCVSMSYVFASDEAMFQLRGLVQEIPNLHTCHFEIFRLESAQYKCASASWK